MLTEAKHLQMLVFKQSSCFRRHNWNRIKYLFSVMLDHTSMMHTVPVLYGNITISRRTVTPLSAVFIIKCFAFEVIGIAIFCFHDYTTLPKPHPSLHPTLYPDRILMSSEKVGFSESLVVVLSFLRSCAEKTERGNC